MEQERSLHDDGASTATPAARRRLLWMLLVGIAPQWLLIGTSTGAMVVGAFLLCVALALVELHLSWCARGRGEYRIRARTVRIARSFAPPPLWLRVGSVGATVALLVLIWTQVRTGSLLFLSYIALSLLIGAVCWTTLVWMTDAWRDPAAFDETRLPPTDLAAFHSFSLIVPARHEENVLAATLSRLIQTDHPDFEVIVVVGHDDEATAAVAQRFAAAHRDLVKVVVDHSWPKNKPKALNTALPYCRGEIVGVFDAEDDVHPALVRRVDQCLQRTGADVVQAGVQLTNLHSSWFSLRNALEYYFWFRSRLQFHARVGFIPLGGNTVFMRTEVLRQVGGWDEECLAEDCEIGVRLSSMGAKTVVFYEPELVTREETPPTLRAFVRQRTRWNQGYLQTLSRGYWRNLPQTQRALGVYTLAMPYLLALAWLMIPTAIGTAIAVTAPVPLTMLLFLPIVPMLVVLAVETAGLGDLCRSFGERASVRDYARLVIGLPVYQVVLAFAAVRAVIREAVGARGWEKTAHFGLHRAHADRVPEPAYQLAAVGTSDGTAATVPRPGLVLWHTNPNVEAFALGTAPSARSAPQVIPLPHHDGPAPVPDVGRTTRDTPLWIRLRTGRAGGAYTLRPADAIRIVPPTSDTPGRRGLRALLAWLRTAVPAIGLLAVFTCVSLVQVANIAHWPGTFFDEGTYISNAWAVQTHGALSNYTYGYGHPPLGWLLISLWTWTTRLFGNTVYSVGVGRQLMAALTIVSCWLVYVLARRLGIRRPFAAVAVALFGLSPLSLYFHRLVLIDNPGVTFALGAFVLALSPKRRLWTFAASGACFAASVLAKETMLLLLPVLFLIAFSNLDRRNRRYCVTFLVAFVTLVGLGYPLYALLKGELFPGPGHVSLIDEAVYQLFSRQATGALFNAHSETYQIVRQWWNTDPWLLGGAALFTPIALARRSTRAVGVAFVFQALMVLRPGYLPYMYVIALLPFAALIVACGMDTLWAFAVDGPRQREQNGGRLRSIVAAVSRRLAPVTRTAAAGGLLSVMAVAALVVSPGWGRYDRAAMTVRYDKAERAAEQWIVSHVGHTQRILVSDNFWIDLIERGFDAKAVKGGFYSRTVLFYWSFDFDPAVERLVPDWKNIDYVVSTQGMRSDIANAQVPKTALAVEHSHVVVTFGNGDQRIEIRAIDGHVSAPLDLPRSIAQHS